jgi:cytochrome c biogenesis protein CcmG/thiol:disulfide interchange protein DsbE
LTIPPVPDELPVPTGAEASTPGDTSLTQAHQSAAPPSPKRLRAFLIGLVLAAALAFVLFIVLGTTSSKRSGGGAVVSVGSVAPNFTLPSVTGAPPVVLAALGVRRHHPVVLNFFASWCVPCQEETPLLASTASSEQARGSIIQFVGVDAADKPSDAVPFIRSSGITYPVGQDSDLRVTANLYGLNGEPQTFFIDESGVVVGHVLGAVSKEQLDGWIRRLAGGG